MAELYYQSIGQPSVAEFKDRGSRFLAYAFPIETVEDFKIYLQNLKKEHPKAVHHCFAYRIDKNNFRVSDDGEPSGTAGKPILGQIDSKNLTNTLIIVVRYFGGTLLGVPGLINAYKTSATLALQLTTFIQKPVMAHYELQFDYTRMNEVMTLIKQMGCIVEHQDIQLFINQKICIPKIRLEETLYRLKEMHYVNVREL